MYCEGEFVEMLGVEGREGKSSILVLDIFGFFGVEVGEIKSVTCEVELMKKLGLKKAR
jgi:hypothetical protein